MNGGSSGEGSTIGSRGSSAPPLRTSLLDEGNEGGAEDDGIRMGELELMGDEEQEDRPQKVRRMNGSGQGEGEGEGEGNGNDIGNIIDFRHSNGDETDHEGDGMDFNDSTTPSDDSDPQTGREITEEFSSLPIEFDLDMVSKIDGYMEKNDAMNVDDKPDDGHESIETPIEGREPLHEELANELTCGMCAGLFVEVGVKHGMRGNEEEELILITSWGLAFDAHTMWSPFLWKLYCALAQGKTLYCDTTKWPCDLIRFIPFYAVIPTQPPPHLHQPDSSSSTPASSRTRTRDVRR
jgi:hypothetical protein